MILCCIIFHPGMRRVVSNGNTLYLLPKTSRKKMVNSYLGKKRSVCCGVWFMVSDGSMYNLKDEETVQN